VNFRSYCLTQSSYGLLRTSEQSPICVKQTGEHKHVLNSDPPSHIKVIFLILAVVLLLRTPGKDITALIADQFDPTLLELGRVMRMAKYPCMDTFPFPS